MSIYEFTDANGKRLRIVPGWGSTLCNEANLFGNPFSARAFVDALGPDTRMAISRLFMDAFRDQPRHINGPLGAPGFGGSDPNKTFLTPDAKLTRAIANSELVVQLDDSLQPVDDSRAELRMKIRMQLNTLLADERREAAMYQAQMDKESTFTKGLIYTGAFFHGLGNAAWDTLKWAKEVSDLGNPLVQMRNMFNAAYDAYGEDKAVEAFAKNLQAAHWRELVEALGFDPSQISREMIAQAMDAANVIWDDETLRQDLTTFAKDYIKAQHAVELTNMGGGAALEVVITAILAALTAGAGLAIATAAKTRHLPKLRKLGDLLLEFVEQSKKLARYLKEKAKRATKGEKGKPLDAEPVVERVNEPPRGDKVSPPDDVEPSLKDSHGKSVQTRRTVEMEPGKKGSWNKELNGKLEPDTDYKVGEYTYSTNSEGNVSHVHGKLKLETRDRNTYQQTKSASAGGIKDGLKNDDGGHIVASIFDGPGEQINYLPMDSNLNRGRWKSMENKWSDALRSGKEVRVDIKPIYQGTSKRPEAFNVQYWIDGKKKTAFFQNKPGG